MMFCKSNSILRRQLTSVVLATSWIERSVVRRGFATSLKKEADFTHAVSHILDVSFLVFCFPVDNAWCALSAETTPILERRIYLA